MFQKLYRHLEEISKSLREGRRTTTSAQGEIIDQLETINVTLVRLNQQLVADRKEDERKAEARQGEEAAHTKPLNRTGIGWLTMTAALIPLLIFMAFNLVQINHTLRVRPMQTTVMAQPAPIAPAIAAPSTGRLDTAERLAVQQHLAKLDSLIMEQNQTITELKRLNSTAVTTMQRIRRHFVLSEHIVKASSTPAMDSLAVAR